MPTIHQLVELDAWDLNSQISYLLGSSYKTEKTPSGLKTGITIQYLSPHSESGLWNLCPWASKGCAAACLKSSGHMVYKGSELARVRRTVLFMKHRNAYLGRLIREIQGHVRRCKAKGLHPAVRLNGTSDIAWESTAPWLFEAFPNVQFYDYTKSYDRMISWATDATWPANYHLTFSAHENTPRARIHSLGDIDNANTAVVFGREVLGPNKALPEEWEGLPVIDGDVHDYRPDDPCGVIVGLREKGLAKKDKTGFVVRSL